MAVGCPHIYNKSNLWDISCPTIFSNRCLKSINYHQTNCNKKLTILTIPLKIKLEQLFGIVDYRIKEDTPMSHKEIELIDMICNDQNPAEAFMIAVETIIDFLEQSESGREPSPALFQEPA